MDEFGVDFTPKDVRTMNTALHLEDTITPELIDEVGFDDVLDDFRAQRLKEKIDEGILNQLDEYEFDGFDLDDEDLKEFAEECKMSEEELEILLRIQAAYMAADDMEEVEEILEEEMEHLAVLPLPVVAAVAVHVEVTIY
ncbi:hypothetical protein [Halovivax ruber]|nr:hypothetical protein [Halovivax ruber]